MNTASGLVS